MITLLLNLCSVNDFVTMIRIKLNIRLNILSLTTNLYRSIDTKNKIIYQELVKYFTIRSGPVN